MAVGFTLLAAVVAQQGATCCDGTICGRVVGEAQVGLAGARVTAANGETVLTDAEGRFILPVPSRPDSEVTVSAENHLSRTVNRSDLSAAACLVHLDPAVPAVEEDIVVIARQQSLPFARQTINKLELLTDPIANADALLAVAGLPTSTNLDNSADVQLRGGAVGLSRVYYNDIPLYEVVRGQPVDQVTRVASIFNPNIIRVVETYPTLPPTYLANSAAGAIRILADVDRNSPSSLFVGLPGATFNDAGALPGDGDYQAYVSAIDLSGTLALNPALKATTTSFRSASLGGVAQFPQGDSGKVSLLSIADAERGVYQLRILNLSGPSINQRLRLYNAASLETPAGDARVKLDAALTLTRNQLRYLDFRTSSRNVYAYGNLDVAGQALHGKLEYRGGVFAEYFRIAAVGALDFASATPSLDRTVRIAAYGAAHGFLTYPLTDELTIAVGTRHVLASSIRQSASYSAAVTTASPDGRHKLIVGGGDFSALIPPEPGTTPAVLVARSRQAAIDYEFTGTDVRLRAGAYLKSDDLAGARTRIRGVDGSAQVQFSPSTSIGAAFARSEQRSDSFRGDRDLGYLIRLQARIGLTSASTINATYTLRSGAPFTRVVSGEDDGAGGFVPVFEPVRNIRRLSDYRALDLNFVTRLPLHGLGRGPIFFISVTNLLDRKNEARVIYDVDFGTEGRVYFDRRAISFGFVTQLR